MKWEWKKSGVHSFDHHAYTKLYMDDASAEPSKAIHSFEKIHLNQSWSMDAHRVNAYFYL